MLTTGTLERLERDLRRCLDATGADRERARGSRRAQGAYFTPAPLVRFVVERVLRARFQAGPVAWRRDGSPRLRVVDPAAGDGRFLTAALEWLSARAGEQGHRGPSVQEAIARRCLVGVERDARFAALARRAIPGAPIYHGEALLAPPVELDGVDAVVGNPPYLRSIHFARTDRRLWTALRGRYAATSRGEWDLYAAFIEQAFAWLGACGQVGLVVPSRWITAAFAAGLRAKLAREAAVSGVVDFGAEQVFADATTYASVVFLSRSPAANVAVARRSEAGWRCGAVAADELDGEPWRLWVGRRRRLLEWLAGRGPTLGEVARIAKGTGTNADPVYVLELRDERHGLVDAYSRALGRPVTVEAEALRPCLRGRDVRAYGDPDVGLRCLLPYDARGVLWAPDELRRRAPRAAAYLDECRRRLEARERGRFRGDTFYRHGRPQNIAWLLDTAAKVVVPDVARAGRALVDDSGALVLDSAYAIRGTAGSPGPSLLLAVLNSPIVRLWLCDNGVPLRGGYLRLKTAYLASLPLPPPSSHTRAVERGLAAGAIDPAAIDELLRKAYAVRREDWLSPPR